MKYTKYSACLVGAALLLGGCRKQLQQENPESIGDQNAFTTIEHVQLGVNGAFGRHAAAGISDVNKNALVSDEAKLGVDNAGGGALTYRYQYGADNTTGGDVIAGYASYYALIDQVNRVLPHVHTVSGGDEARKNVLEAHLLGLRGIAHFGLLQSFSKNYDPSGLGIAIVTTADPVAKPARNTMGEVMAQIESDLTNAKNLLPAVTAANFSDTVLNKLNIAAYQARIALYRRDYAAAITYSTEVISSGLRPLASGADYAGIWTDATPLATNEVLFRTRLLQSTALGGLFANTGGSIFIAPSDKLYNSYSANDTRRSIFIGTAGSGARYINKHWTSSRGARIVDLKAARTSEMYLIRAEAYAKLATPNLAAGTADLNALRAKRITGYVDETFANPAALVTAVLEERFKELCFEGFRLYDLKRNNLPVQRAASDASPEWQTLPANSHLFVFPIPRDAVNANPNTQQNEGY